MKEIDLKELDKVDYVLIDLWGTIFIENDKDINIDRAKILYFLIKKHDVNYWYQAINDNIRKFKKEEKKGFSIKLDDRIKGFLNDNGIIDNNYLINKIICEFDKLFIEYYQPNVNYHLIDLIKDKKAILVSNTGLVSKKCINKILKQKGIYYIFYKKIYSEDTLLCKPNPDFINAIINSNRISLNNCIFIGDSYEMDYLPCKKLKIKCYIYDWGKYYYDI